MYPVTMQADYVPEQSRLKTLFRGLLSFPAGLVSGLYGFAAYFAAFFAWFAILFTGKYPEGLYNFVGGYLRNMTRVNAYSYLLTDVYPPFNGEPDDSYPIRVGISPPPESLSRAKAFFKFILAIPVLIVWYLYLIGAFFCWAIGWFAVLFTGKMPEGMWNFIAKTNSFHLKTSAYLFYMTDDYPPFSEDISELTSGSGGAGLPSGGAVTATPEPAVAPPPPPATGL